MSKYAANSIFFTYPEFNRLLVPRTRYQSLSATIRDAKTSNKRISVCGDSSWELVQKDSALLLKKELEALKYFIQGKNQLMTQALRNGVTLWRVIDKGYSNQLTNKQIEPMMDLYGFNWNHHNWKAFLRYTADILTSEQGILRQQEFTKIFNPEQYAKQTYAVEVKKMEYPFQTHRVELEMSRRTQEEDYNKRAEKLRIYYAKEGTDHPYHAAASIKNQKQFAKTLTQEKRDMLRSMSQRQVRSLARQQHLPESYQLGRKRLMNYRNIGYRPTSNHIKICK